MGSPNRKAWLLSGMLSLIAACTYSPNITSGTLKCSDYGECPRGFSCSANLCVSASTSGRTAADYIGTWQFGAGAAVQTMCEDGAKGTSSLVGSTLVITAGAGGGTNLLAAWDQWDTCVFPTFALSYNASGAYLNDDTWICDDSTSEPELTWIVDSFEVVPSSATAATHKAVYFRQDTYPSTNTTIICTQTVTASMTKK